MGNRARGSGSFGGLLHAREEARTSFGDGGPVAQADTPVTSVAMP
jgi:hypothetical protein